MSTVDQLARDVPAQLLVAPPASDWTDVTQLFSAAANELRVGQLVHVENFNLFDSMSALELMDPKMDAGLLLHGAAPLPVAERVVHNTIPLRFTSARDVLATVDELFRVEAAWLNGQAMPQTLLTCVYMHRDAISALLKAFLEPSDAQKDECESETSSSLEERVLTRLQSLSGSTQDTLLVVMAALCVFTLRASAHAREVVVRADIYEEEDFSPGNAGSLDTSVFDVWTRPALELLLMHAIERMEALLTQERAAVATKATAKKAAKKKSGASKTKPVQAAESDTSSGPASAKLDGLDSNVKISALLCEALLRRLQLRKVLHVVYSDLGLAEQLADLELAKSGLSSALELIKEMAAEALEFDSECFSGKAFGFDKSLSRLFTSGSPPRDVKPTSMEEALKIYDKLLSDLVVACSPGEWTMMEQVRVFLADFSRRQPNIIARSYVLLLLYCEKKIYGKYGFMDWLTEEMIMNGVPSVLLSTQEGVQFSARGIETVYESLKLFLHNRSRERARVEYLLEEWAVLQVEAVAVDERFMAEMQIPKAAYPRYFTAWTLEQVAQLMIHYVLLGFELELYAPNEYSTIYWYLDYLCGARLQNLNFTWGFLERMKDLMKDRPQRGRAPPPAPAAAEDENAVDPTKRRFLREISYTEMLRGMMRAYFQTCAAFEREKLVDVAPPVYGSRVIRFQHRFAAFQSLQFPAPLSYDDYLANCDFSRFGVDLIYKSAEECFKVARGHGDETRAITADELLATGNSVRVSDVPDVVHVAVANLVHLARREQEQQQLQQQLKGNGGRKAKANQAPISQVTSAGTVEFDFSKHPHFPVLLFGPASEKR